MMAKIFKTQFVNLNQHFIPENHYQVMTIKDKLKLLKDHIKTALFVYEAEHISILWNAFYYGVDIL